MPGKWARMERADRARPYAKFQPPSARLGVRIVQNAISVLRRLLHTIDNKQIDRRLRRFPPYATWLLKGGVNMRRCVGIGNTLIAIRGV